MYKTGTYLCLQCGKRFDLLVTKSEYDQDVVQECPECHYAECSRVPGCPMVTEASYPDGKKRFCQEKEWSALNCKLAATDYRKTKERAEIQKQMDVIKPPKEK